MKWMLALIICIVLNLITDESFAFWLPNDTLEIPDPALQFDENDDVPLETDAKEHRDPVIPLVFQPETGFSVVLTDSIFRWEQWTTPSEWYHNRRDAITYRLGMFGRHDYISVAGRRQEQHRFYYDGIPMHQRLSGQTNSHILPWHRLETVTEHSTGAWHHLHIQPRSYYVVRPLTWIVSEISEDNYRNTEVMLTRNLDEKTNLEASWWDKRSDPGYPRNRLQGNQFSFVAQHHLTEQWVIRASMLRTVLDKAEPGGFAIADMATFPFFPDNTQAIHFAHASERKDQLFYATALYRPDDSKPVLARFSLYTDRSQRRYLSPDTLQWQTRTTGIAGFLEHRGSKRDMGTRFGIERTRVSNVHGIPNFGDDFYRWHLYPRVSMDLAKVVRIQASVYAEQIFGNAQLPNSDEIMWDAGTRLTLFPEGKLSVTMGHSVAALPGSLLHHALFSETSSFLKTEQVQRSEASIIIRPNDFVSLSSALHRSQHRDVFFFGAESHTEYEQWGVHLNATFDVPRWEGFAGAYMQRQNTEYLPDDMLWIRAGLYYKNFIYDRAAFMKAGIKGIVSPFAYRTPFYQQEYDWWIWLVQEETQKIPAFQRIDMDASVRVRSAIFLLQFENILGAFVPFVPSYFETANYPMPNYRFRFGVRWQLRN